MTRKRGEKKKRFLTSFVVEVQMNKLGKVWKNGLYHGGRERVEVRRKNNLNKLVLVQLVNTNPQNISIV